MGRSGFSPLGAGGGGWGWWWGEIELFLLSLVTVHQTKRKVSAIWLRIIIFYQATTPWK